MDYSPSEKRRNARHVRFVAVLVIMCILILAVPNVKPVMADIAKILKSESVYVTLDARGKPVEAELTVAIRWVANKLLQLYNRFALPKFELLSSGAKINQPSANRLEVAFGDNDTAYLKHVLAVDKISIPVYFTITYIFNGKESTPSKFLGQKGTLEIHIKANNTQWTKVSIEYQHFPDEQTVKEDVDVQLPYIVLLTTDFPIIKYDDVTVTEGIKTFKGENYSIILPMFPYPTQESVISLRGTIDKLPNILMTASMVAFDLPSFVTSTYDQANQIIIDNFKSYLSIKDMLMQIIDLETQVINQIDTFQDALNKTLPQFIALQDLLNFYIGNLEKVIKTNTLFVNILSDMKNYLGFDDTSLGYIQQFVDLNNTLINMVLNGTTQNNQKVPGIYNIPDLIASGQDASLTINQTITQFRDMSAKIREALSGVKGILDNYEKTTISIINYVRRDSVKYQKLLDLTQSFAKDWSLSIDRTNLPAGVFIDQSYTFNFKIDFSRE